MPGVFDRTPILLGTARNLAGISDKAIAIGAICAIYLLKQVEISQVVSIEDQIVAAFDLFDAVDRKADRLVHGDEHIQQYEGYYQGVDDGGRDYVHQVRVEDITCEIYSQRMVRS